MNTTTNISIIGADEKVAPDVDVKLADAGNRRIAQIVEYEQFIGDDDAPQRYSVRTYYLGADGDRQIYVVRRKADGVVVYIEKRRFSVDERGAARARINACDISSAFEYYDRAPKPAPTRRYL